MDDLNNIFYFVKIVEHGSLSAASEALGVAKSMLSQHLVKLEKSLGVNLVQRTSRKFRVTDIGARYYDRCCAILLEVRRASSMIDHARTLPRGKLRISSPLNFTQVALAPILSAFLVDYPEIDLSVDITNRDGAILEEGYDLAMHIGPAMRPSNLITRSFLLGQEMLVASRELLARLGTPRTPADLKSMPSLAGNMPPEMGGRYLWHLTGPDGASDSVPHCPRLVTEDLWVIRQSALAGCGVAALPLLLCRDALQDGRLVGILPEWSLPVMKLHLLYMSKNGLTLAARTLINYFSDHLRPSLDTVSNGTLQMLTNAA